MHQTAQATHSIWHHQQALTLLGGARLDLSHHHRAHVLVFVNDWHDEWTVGLAVERWQVIDERDESWAGVPRAGVVEDRIFDSLAGYSRHWHECQIFCFEAESREDL